MTLESLSVGKLYKARIYNRTDGSVMPIYKVDGIPDGEYDIVGDIEADQPWMLLSVEPFNWSSFDSEPTEPQSVKLEILTADGIGCLFIDKWWFETGNLMVTAAELPSP